ncbi:MAG: YggT family protein [Desulfosalsimonadaceae bacterium]
MTKRVVFIYFVIDPVLSGSRSWTPLKNFIKAGFDTGTCYYSKQELLLSILLANFIMGIARVLEIGLNLYMFIVIAYAILSWVNPDPYNPIVRLIRQITEPVMYRVRRHIPTGVGGIDFAPLIVVLAIYFLQIFVVQTLFQLARQV